jgi:hypothetical protein
MPASVAHRQRDTEAGPCLADQSRRGRAAADHDGAHRREVGRVERRIAQHQRQLRRHTAERRDPELGHNAQRLRRLPRLPGQVLGASLLQVARQLGGRAEVGQGRPGHGVTAAAPGLADVAGRDEGDLAPAEHRPLGQARRPGREDDGDGPVLVAPERGRRFAPPAQSDQ